MVTVNGLSQFFSDNKSDPEIIASIFVKPKSEIDILGTKDNNIVLEKALKVLTPAENSGFGQSERFPRLIRVTTSALCHH